MTNNIYKIIYNWVAESMLIMMAIHGLEPIDISISEW